MLYLTTRNKADSYTAHRVLRFEAAPDGGMFMPMHVPRQSPQELRSFAAMPLGDAVATILNLFFGSRISGWDVDFAIGRQCVTLDAIGHRAMVSETWHNPSYSHDYTVQRLFELVCGGKAPLRKPNTWFYTAVDIAFLFGLYGRLCRGEIFNFDIAVQSGDLRLMLAVRYAQKMGLPIDKVILGTMDGDGLWELFSFGDYPSAAKTPPQGLEGLLWMEFGYEAATRYLEAVDLKKTYRLPANRLEIFRSGVFPAVVGERRTADVADRVRRTNQYAMDNAVACAFGALQDYRAKSGEKKNTLLLSLEPPASF